MDVAILYVRRMLGTECLYIPAPQSRSDCWFNFVYCITLLAFSVLFAFIG
jgi:hypothetical protein